MAEDPREPLGRIAWETFVAWACEQPGMTVRRDRWEDLSDEEREMSMRIGSAVAAQAVADAGLEAAELRKRLMGWEAAGPAILEALSIAVATVEYDHLKGRYKRTWAAVNALEEGTGHG